MSSIVNCPACGHRCRIPDSALGRRCRCAACGADFTSTAHHESAGTPPTTAAIMGPVRGEAIAAPWIGLGGAALLFLGAFLPLVSAPLVGHINYIRSGHGDGIIIVVLAGLAACAALGRWYRGLWTLGLLAIAVMSFTFTVFQMSVGDDRGRVQLEWGWAVLAVGAIMTVAAAATALATRHRRSATLILPLAAVSMIGTSVATAAVTWGVPTAITAYYAAEDRAARQAADEAAQLAAQRAREEEQRRETARREAEQEMARVAAERDNAKREALRDQTQQTAVALNGQQNAPPQVGQWADAAIFMVCQGDLCATVTGLELDGNLTVEVTVQNRGNGPIEIQPWSRVNGKDAPELVDPKGRRWSVRLAGAPGAAMRLRAGGRYQDRLTFTGVTDENEYLGLELPAGVFRGYGKLRLRISRSMLILKTAGARGPVAVPGLVDLLADPATSIRIEALTGLAREKAAARSRFDVIAERLADADPNVRQAAATALRAFIPYGRNDVPKLKSLLKRPPVEVREFAIRTLRDCGPEAASATDELADALQDDNGEIREMAAATLGQIGAEAAVAAPALVKALDDSAATVRLAALRALAALPPTNDTATQLVKAIRHADESVAAAAADAAARHKLVGREHVPSLVDALRRAPVSARPGIVAALRRIGGDAKDAIPALVDALADRDPAMRKQVVEVLASFGAGANAAVPTLAKLLADGNVEVKRAAADALGRLGLHASAAAPALVTALKDESVSDRAEWALIRSGPPGAAAILDFVEKSNQVSTKLKMIAIVEKMGKDAKVVLPRLESVAATDPIGSVRRAATQAAEIIRKAK